MTPLRQKMIESMQVRGFAVRTHESYLTAVAELSRYYKRSPDRLDTEEIQAFFLHLVKERKLSGATCRLYLNAIRFFYLKVMQWPSFDVAIQIPKKAQRIPELLTRAEVAKIIMSAGNHKHRQMLLTCYGCGLRVSELVALKVRDIDGERHLLRVVQGKGAKDRLVIISEALLAQLRRYWQRYRPVDWLFAGREPTEALSITSTQKFFTQAKRRAGVHKIGGIHALRHAYATHQLDAGMPVHQLQRQLGHRNIHTTLRYVHWVPNYRESAKRVDLIDALGVAHA